MKKSLLAVAIMLVCLLALVGCSGQQDTAQPDTAGHDITRVTIEYDAQPGVHRKVVIDTEKSEKKTVEYAEDKNELVESFAQTKALTDFIDTHILGSQSAGSDSGSSDELVLWKLRITAGGDTTALYGTESEGFPGFWEELLLLAGE